MAKKGDVIGIVVGKTSKGYTQVRLCHWVEAEFGELWIVETENRKYFSRVVDTDYGENITNNESINDFARALIDDPNLKLSDIDKEDLGYNFAFVDLLGIINHDAGQIEDFYSRPGILSRVRKPSSTEYELLVR